MKKSRRDFMRLAGLSALGLGAGMVSSARATDEHAAPAEGMPAGNDIYAPNDEAIHATHWGMVIDTRALEDPAQFEKIINACHKLHNVPDIKNKREIKWIWTDSFEHTFTDKESHYRNEEIENRDFLLLCNHCENPPCCRVCPTRATFQRPDGIVLMDFHRCIGCRFCMAACPYGARSFNFGDPRPYIEDTNPEFPTRMRGVVEKCNFCAERLAVGKMPACVEASDGAILFGDLDDPDSEVRAALRENFTIRRKPALGTQPSVYYII